MHLIVWIDNKGYFSNFYEKIFTCLASFKRNKYSTRQANAHSHTHTHIHTHIHTHAHSYTYTRTYTLTHTYSLQTHSHTHIHCRHTRISLFTADTGQRFIKNNVIHKKLVLIHKKTGTKRTNARTNTSSYNHTQKINPNMQNYTYTKSHTQTYKLTHTSV